MDKERLSNARLEVINKLAEIEELAAKKHGKAAADFVHEVAQEKISRWWPKKKSEVFAPTPHIMLARVTPYSNM